MAVLDERMLDRVHGPNQPAARRALRALQACGIEDVDALAAALPELPARKRSSAIWLASVTRQWRRRHRPALLEQLEGVSPVVRNSAAMALADVGGKRVLSALVRLVEDPERSAGVRYDAAYALTCFHADGAEADRVAETFIGVLADPDAGPHVRGQCAEGLGALVDCGDQRTRRYRSCLEALLDSLHDPEPEVRFWCAFGLGKSGSRRALPHLRRAVREDDGVCPGWWRVADEAADAILSLDGRYDEIPERTSRYPQGRPPADDEIDDPER